jgi:glycosyltransferase involved in cell wall biosynthesis
MGEFKKITILVPAYNEKRTIKEVLEKVRRAPLPHGLEKEILVIDDGSCDSTREKLSEIPGVQIFFHDRNQGKGAAIKTGLRHATGDIILIQDADSEYSPEDYPVVLQPILSGFVELVMGSRFLCESPKFFTKNGDPFFSHFIGNTIIIGLTNFLYGQKMTDYEGGYKAFTVSLARSIPVSADGFEFDNELLCKSIRRGYKIAEVPIHYKPRLYTEGKKIGWQDGLLILWTILKWRFKRI